jgi:SPP1 gp7 family putative phage head morphogenesis protein
VTTPAAVAAALHDHVVEAEAAVSRLTTTALRKVIIAAWTSALHPGVVTAAADPVSLAPIASFSPPDDVSGIIAETFTAGGLAAWASTAASAAGTPSEGLDFARMQSETSASQRAGLSPYGDQAAIDYLDQANNRLVGIGQSAWEEARTSLTEGLADGDDREAMKGRLEDVLQVSEFRADTITRTEVNMAANAGVADQAAAISDAGVPVVKQWFAQIDDRTRDTHADADGQQVPVDDAFEVGDAYLDFPGDPTGPPEEVINCRCTHLVVVDESDTPIEVEPPEPPEPTYAFGNISDLSVAPIQQISVGAHTKTVYSASDGTLWMFKPQEAFRAELDVATAKLQSLAGLPAPETYRVTIGGRDGSIQQMFGSRSEIRSAFGHGAFDPTLVSKADMLMAEKHEVFDWVISNHDGHPEQFIRKGYASHGDEILGIDKGQAFRFFGKDRLAADYHPNSVYGAAEPIYNTISRAFAEDRLPDYVQIAGKSAESRELRATAERITNIPDSEYRAILRPYAEGAANEGVLAFNNNVEAFLDAAVARKNAAYDDIHRYQERLYAARAKVRAANKAPAPAPGGASYALKGMTGAKPVDLSGIALARQKAFEVVPHGTAGSHPDIVAYTRSSNDTNMPMRAAAKNETVGGARPSDFNSTVRARAAGIRNDLRPLTGDVLVYRGTKLPRSVLDAVGGNPRMLTGHVLTDHGFLSTSIDPNNSFVMGGEYRFEIRVTRESGVKGLYVDHISRFEGEAELLLEDGAHLYVHGVHRDPAATQWIVEAEVVPKGWTPAGHPKVLASARLHSAP